MMSTVYLNFASIFQYIGSNLTCTLYGTQFSIYKTTTMTTYFSLLTDLAEAFGIWAAMAVLLLATLLATTVVQQTTASTFGLLTTTGNNSSSEKNLNSVIYSLFTRRVARLRIK